jgi:hypothetical protein
MQRKRFNVFLSSLGNSSQTPNNFPPRPGLWYVRKVESVVDKHDVYLEMRLKIEAVFEHYTGDRNTTSGRTLRNALKWKTRSID